MLVFATFLCLMGAVLAVAAVFRLDRFRGVCECPVRAYISGEPRSFCRSTALQSIDTMEGRLSRSPDWLLC